MGVICCVGGRKPREEMFDYSLSHPELHSVSRRHQIRKPLYTDTVNYFDMNADCESIHNETPAGAEYSDIESLSESPNYSTESSLEVEIILDETVASPKRVWTKLEANSTPSPKLKGGAAFIESIIRKPYISQGDNFQKDLDSLTLNVPDEIIAELERLMISVNSEVKEVVKKFVGDVMFLSVNEDGTPVLKVSKSPSLASIKALKILLAESKVTNATVQNEKINASNENVFNLENMFSYSRHFDGSTQTKTETRSPGEKSTGNTPESAELLNVTTMVTPELNFLLDHQDVLAFSKQQVKRNARKSVEASEMLANLYPLSQTFGKIPTPLSYVSSLSALGYSE